MGSGKLWKFNVPPRSILVLSCSHFLSTWGDRMWSYAVALFLVEIGCGSLLLPAIFGLVLAAVNFFGGTIIGQWVDKAQRLWLMKVSLFVQNILVTLCAGLLVILLHFQTGALATHGVVYYVSLVLVICLSAAANLIGQGTTIAVERDWVVVITAGDSALLARTNAIMRRIDLINKIVSPLPVSFLMSRSLDGLIQGAIFIAVWNVASGFLEYLLVLYVHRLVPALATKSSSEADSGAAVESEQERLTADEEDGVVANDATSDDGAGVAASAATSQGDLPVGPSSTQTRTKQFLLLLILPYTKMLSGLRVYRSQTVLRAGISLSFLYMTVLGFNGITNGFLYSQGLEVWQVSISQAFGALFGVLGTFLYQPLHQRVGHVMAGLVAVWAEAACLTLCAASVFVTGNPASTPVQAGICESNSSTPGGVGNMTWTRNTSTGFLPVSDYSLLDNGTDTLSTLSPTSPSTIDAAPVLSTSLIFFLVGIITARIGLWMFDLAITQLYQEEVPEEHRGTVGGVQTALNSNMDLLHFILVIAFPNPQQFGGLVLASVGAVVLAALLYSSFVRSHSRAPLCTVSGDGSDRCCSLCCCGSWWTVRSNHQLLTNSPEDGGDLHNSAPDELTSITNTAEL